MGEPELDLSIEYPFIKVVQECIVKGNPVREPLGFKNAKKYIEKGIHSAVAKVQSLRKNLGKDALSADDVLAQDLDKLRSLKSKYMEMLRTEDRLLDICKKRILHLLEVQVHHKDSWEVNEAYHITRMDRLLLDHFLREGYFDTSRVFTKELELDDFSDMDIFTESKEIVVGLLAHKCEAAIQWCVTHKTKLGGMKSTMEMQLRIQEFVELVKLEKYKEAVDYAKKHFKKYMEDHPDIMKRVMTLLAVSTSFNEALKENYKDLLSETRWGSLAGMFMQESYRLHSLTSESLLSLTLQAGLASLRTTFCDDPATKKERCPTCSQLLGQLATMLPYSYHLHTSVVCRVTGEVMNENNPPMALPNGYVFSEKGLQMRMDKAKNTVMCPITGAVFPMSSVQKVYFC